MLMMSTHMVFAQNAPYLEASSVNGQSGDQIEISISIKNNPGFGGIAYDVIYDNTALELVSYELGLGSAICVDSGIGTYDNKVNFQYAGIQGVEGDGVLVKLVFKILAEAPCTAEVTVAPIEGSNFYYEGQKEILFSLATVSATVTVEEPEIIPSVGETMLGYNLTMQGSGSGDIGVNLNFSANEALRGDAEAYVKVLYKGKETKYMLSTLTFDGEGNTRLTTYVPAKEMANDITATVYNGAGECGASYTYSVKSYAEYILEHSSEYDAKLVSMVKATLNYGAYAQKYFGYNTEKLANSSLSTADGQGAIDAVTSIDVADPVYNGTVSAAGLAKHSVSIVLGSETTVKHYITLAEGQDISSFMFQLGGATVTPVAEGDRYCITISNIEAADLDSGTMLQVICMNPFGMYNVTYSAMNYVEAMFNACKDKAEYTDLCNLLKAIYLYNDAANTYFGK